MIWAPSLLTRVMVSDILDIGIWIDWEFWGLSVLDGFGVVGGVGGGRDVGRVVWGGKGRCSGGAAGD